MAKLLVVDHDTNSARDLVTYLTNNGHEADFVESAEEALERALGADLLLVSSQLPDLSGTELCRTVRAHEQLHALPVIMLSPSNDEIDRVVSFEVGADDFMAKPYSLRELELRVRAVLRRKPRTSPRRGATRLGTLEIDRAAHRVTVQGVEVMLSALEFNLLVNLYERRGHVESRQGLIETVWAATKGVSTRTVDACVKRLRQKLGPAGHYIQTVRGVGYRFSEDR